MHLLLRRRWLAAHLVVLVVAGTFVGLGRWQLRRLDQTITANAEISSRTNLPVTGIESAYSPSGAYRRAEISGTYDTANEIILVNRSLRGVAGHHVLTPLRSGDRAVVVDRGWVPLNSDDPPVPDALPPRGRVTLTGVLLEPPERGRFGPRDLGDEPRSFRIEPGKIARRAGYPVAPLYLLLATQDPSQAGIYPTVVRPEALSRGPHLSYALQWFAFALAALGTYAAYARAAVRRAARRVSPVPPA